MPVKVITNHAALTNGKNVSSRMIRWILKLAELNVKWEHRSGHVLFRNPVESTGGGNVACAVIRDLILSTREQLIEEQRRDP
ncbi:hypothetical protein TNCV_3106851 [Trichonephila clavipes]|nr:hypothetical protein TNCV_3106851 [Trichonephila clavipes]